MMTNESHLMEGFLFEESGFTAQLCLTEESVHEAWKLRYRAYRSVDGIAENKEGMAVDMYDFQSNARTHLIWFEDRPVASVRSLIWSDRFPGLSTTCVDAYRSWVESQLGLDQPILESNRYVVDPDFNGRQSLTAQYLLFRIQTVSCLYDRCKYVITAVRDRHIPFYKRLMGFYPISESIQVPGFQFETTLLATPYENREILAKRAAIAACKLEDYERYVHQLTAAIAI